MKFCGYFPYTGQIYLNGQYAERPAMPHEAETRPVALGSGMRETAYLWVSCPIRGWGFRVLQVLPAGKAGPEASECYRD